MNKKKLMIDCLVMMTFNIAFGEQKERWSIIKNIRSI